MTTKLVSTLIMCGSIALLLATTGCCGSHVSLGGINFTFTSNAEIIGQQKTCDSSAVPAGCELIGYDSYQKPLYRSTIDIGLYVVGGQETRECPYVSYAPSYRPVYFISRQTVVQNFNPAGPIVGGGTGGYHHTGGGGSHGGGHHH
jgi:hypothetical protein